MSFTAPMVRSLGRTIELCGFGRVSRIRTSPAQSGEWRWLIDTGEGRYSPAYTGTLAECLALDSAYKGAEPTEPTDS